MEGGVAARPLPGSRARGGAASPARIARADRLAVLALAVMAIAAAATFADYGIGNDEWNSDRYGGMSLAWYLSGGADRSSFDFYDLHFYGAGIHALIAALERLWPAAGFAARHAVGALLGLAGLAGTWRLGRRLGGTWAGLAALLILALTPYFWGQMAILPVDTPFFAAFVWASLAILRYMDELPRPRASSALLLGGAAGLAAGIRVGGAPILAIDFAFALALHLVARPAGWRDLARTIAWQGPLMLALAWALMVAAWPWALQHPFARPLEALTHFGRLPIDFTFPFWGGQVRTTALPWFYVPGYLLAKLPLLFLAGIVLVPLAMAWNARPSPSLSLPRAEGGLAWGWRRHAAWGVTLFAATFPVVVAIATHATLYDGVRHFLFILAPLAALAGAALVRLAKAVRFGRAALALAGAISAALLLRAEALLHPYEYIWFNALAGGVAGAQDRFEVDYWTLAQTEMITRLRTALRAAGTEERPWRYKLCVYWLDVSPLLPAGWQVVEGDAPVDFVFAPARFPCVPDDGHSLIRVVRDGVVLGWVSDRRPAQ